MAEQKTRPTVIDPNEYVAAITDDRKRADAERALALMAGATGDSHYARAREGHGRG